MGGGVDATRQARDDRNARCGKLRAKSSCEMTTSRTCRPRADDANTACRTRCEVSANE